MRTDTEFSTALHDPPVPVRAKLAAAWTSFMFLYIYVDYFALYEPGVVGDILAGVVWESDITQAFVVIGLALMAIPVFMILLSMTLPARLNRTANLVVASIYVPVSVFNAVDESWTYFYGLSIGLELLLLAFVLRSVWAWPGTPAASTPAPETTRRPLIQAGR